MVCPRRVLPLEMHDVAPFKKRIMWFYGQTSTELNFAARRDFAHRNGIRYWW